MGIFIKNPDVERKVREVARRKGVSITAALDAAFDRELAELPPPTKARTMQELREATDRFRKAVGLDKRKLNVTKADFDALWEIPGLEHEDDES
jgi:antitoxin VapB